MSNPVPRRLRVLKYCHAASAIAVCLIAAPAHADLGDELFRLTASDGPQGGYLFGNSVALSGTTGIIGATLDAFTDTGDAYLFDVSTGDELFKLEPSNAATLPLPANFGISVDISGDMAIVGARGSASGLATSRAYLFDVSNPQAPVETHILNHDGLFGQSVAISGNRAIVGARLDDDDGLNSGSAYLFDVTSGNELFKFTAADAAASDWFGSDVDISGNIAIVGSPFNDDDGDNSGAAYLFDASTGDQLTKFTAPDTAADDNFGATVAIHGNIAAIGSPLDDDAANNAGAVYLFDVSDPRNPVQLHKLLAGNPSVEDRFSSVALSDSSVLVGAARDDNGANDAGAAYLFDITTGVQLARLTASDRAVGDFFGAAVALDGGRALIGAPRDESNGSTVPGSAYVFIAVPEPGAAIMVLSAVFYTTCVTARQSRRMRREELPWTPP